ncbi:MAG: hypothetical protein KJ061_00070, partial [Vicinamibacteraceae bacterium]|nr:hypothetical protein [Vicinamibacteraceae bacterium]
DPGEPRDPGELSESAAAMADHSGTTFVERVSAFERRLIADALARSGGVQTRAARLLGMSERHLRYKMKKHGLEPAAAHHDAAVADPHESSSGS